MKKLLLIAILALALTACSRYQSINRQVKLIPPFEGVTVVLPCDVPGLAYYSEVKRWDCTNTGEIPIGTICQATSRTTDGDYRYYLIDCNGVKGWVNSDFIGSP